MTEKELDKWHENFVTKLSRTMPAFAKRYLDDMEYEWDQMTFQEKKASQEFAERYIAVENKRGDC